MASIHEHGKRVKDLIDGNHGGKSLEDLLVFGGFPPQVLRGKPGDTFYVPKESTRLFNFRDGANGDVYIYLSNFEKDKWRYIILYVSDENTPPNKKNV